MPAETFAGKLLGQTIHEDFEADSKSLKDKFYDWLRDLRDYMNYKFNRINKSFMSYCRCMCIPGTKGKSS